jgi:hypothetical protein
MSSAPKEHLVHEVATPAACIAYFDSLVKNSPLYVCVIGPAGGTPKIYVENTHNKQIYGLVRIFFRRDDITRYADLVAEAERYDPEIVRYWETDTSSVVGVLQRIDAHRRERSGLGITAVTSMVSSITDQVQLLDIDVFWTGDRAVMV